MDLSKLKAPFDPARISWRVGSTDSEKKRGLALAYFDSRDVQDRLDDVCGPENWQCRYMLLGPTTVCEIGIKIGDEWVWKADGAGASDIEAEKGSMSDSFKRASVKWGIGRYLYDLESPWVDIKTFGKSSKIADHEYKRLEGLLAGNKIAATSPASKPSSPVFDRPVTDAVAWGQKALKAVSGFRDAKEFDLWYTEAIKGAIKRLGEHDADLQDRLVKAVLEAQDKWHPVNA